MSSAFDPGPSFEWAAREVFQAYNRGDVERLIELADPEIEFSTYITSVAGETYRGHKGLRDWWNDLQETFADAHVDVDEVVSVSAEAGYVVGRGTAHGRQSGMPMSWPVFQVGVWRESRCTLFRFYPDRATADAAARELAAGAARIG